MKSNAIDILILEDDSNDLELTMRSLKKKYPAASIVATTDGVETLDYLFSEGVSRIQQPSDFPRLMLVDLKVPKVNGMEVIKTIKSHAVLSIIPIVVFSSSNQEEDIVLAYRNGANAYVVKPVQFVKYQEALHHIADFWLDQNRFLRR